MADEQKTKLFREKSLEAIESPESLNDYLRVTSPGVWLALATVIVLLAGMILWGVFGRIDTTTTLAVSAREGQAVCYVPYDVLEKVMAAGEVNVNGEMWALGEGGADVTIISEETDPFVRVTGDLQVGDMTVKVPLEAALENGVYAGTVVTERLKPFSLLMQ